MGSLDRLLELPRIIESIEYDMRCVISEDDEQRLLDEIEELKQEFETKKSEIEKAIEDSEILNAMDGVNISHEESEYYARCEENQKSPQDIINQKIVDRLKELKYNDITPERVFMILGEEK